jgi:ABC-type Zn2+ transport system substrate-binding protein/surface adhesin
MNEPQITNTHRHTHTHTHTHTRAHTHTHTQELKMQDSDLMTYLPPEYKKVSSRMGTLLAMAT